MTMPDNQFPSNLLHIRGRDVTFLKVVGPIESDGDICDGLISEWGEIVKVDSTLKGQRLIEIVLHELLHLAMPGMEERDVEYTAAKQAEGLVTLFPGIEEAAK